MVHLGRWRRDCEIIVIGFLLQFRNRSGDRDRKIVKLRGYVVEGELILVDRIRQMQICLRGLYTDIPRLRCTVPKRIDIGVSFEKEFPIPVCRMHLQCLMQSFNIEPGVPLFIYKFDAPIIDFQIGK